jgi:hypothetical protein
MTTLVKWFRDARSAAEHRQYKHVTYTFQIEAQSLYGNCPDSVWVLCPSFWTVVPDSGLTALIAVARLEVGRESHHWRKFGWPANTPRSAKVLGFFALLPSILAMDFVSYPLGRQHLYDVLWGLPVMLIVLAVIAVPQAQHDRRVRSAA